MNRLKEIRGYLDSNEETPNNDYWEFWINDECIIREPDLDVFLLIPCLEGYTISDIFANELYDKKSLFIF